jgi:S-disulfanyl-L-cysteine oxidoreductase SoxD
VLELASSEPLPGRFGFGRPATSAEIAALDLDVGPDGTGLPPGGGTALEGAPIYADKCAACHGAAGEGVPGLGDVLVGRIHGDAFDFSEAFPSAYPRTIGSYWPFATTIFDYVRRAMPFDRPGSLTDFELYALTAYLLHLNRIIPEDVRIDAESLPRVVMPARDRFVLDDRESSTRVR